jgi:O-antigen/teichoic acid export membrane protein
MCCKEKNLTTKIPNQNFVKSIAKGGGLKLIGEVINKGINFVSQIVIARILGVNNFGLYSLGFVIFNLAQTLSQLGLSQGVIRYVAVYRMKKKQRKVKGAILQAIIISGLVGMIIGVMTFSASNAIAKLFNRKELALVIKMFSFSIPFMAVMIILANAAIGFQKVLHFVYVKNIFYPIGLLFIFILLHFIGFQLSGIIFAHLISAALGILLSLYFFKKDFFSFFKVKASFIGKKLITFSIPLVGIEIMHMFFLYTDITMIGFFYSPFEVGIYNAVSKVAVFLGLGLMMFSPIFSSMIAGLHATNKISDMRYILQITSRWVLIITVPIFIITIFSGYEILAFFGDEFKSGFPALLALSVFRFFSYMFGPTGRSLIMTGNQKIEFFNFFGGLILNIILNLFFIPKFGIVGAAFATGISLFIIHLVRFLEVKFLLGITSISKKYLDILFAGIITGVIMVFINLIFSNLNSISSLILNIAFVGIIFGMIVRSRLEDEDKIVINAVKKKFLFYKK